VPGRVRLKWSLYLGRVPRTSRLPVPQRLGANAHAARLDVTKKSIFCTAFQEGQAAQGGRRERAQGELASGASCQPQSELDRTPLVERGAAEPDGGEKPHGPSWAGNGVDPSAACVQAHACTEEERNGGLAETGTNKITHRMQAQDHASLRPQSCMAGQISFGSGRPIDRSAAVAL